MTATLLAGFLPVFAVIAIGYAVRAGGLLPRPAWAGINALNYRVLLPALIFTALARTEFLHGESLHLAALSLAGIAILLVIGWGAARAMRLAPAVTGAFIPVVGVWNIVLILTLATSLFGADAAATAIRVIMPGAVLGTLAARLVVARASARVRWSRLFADPMLVSVAAGLAASFTPLDRTGAVMGPLDIIAASSMGVIVLSIGAGLDFAALKGRLTVLAAAAGLRALVSPLIFLGLGLAMGLSGEALAIVLLTASAPTAAFVFALIAEFKGEEALTAGMITASVLASAVTAPAFVALALTL